MDCKLNNYINSKNKIKSSESISNNNVSKPNLTKKVNVAIVSFGGGVFGNITSSGLLTNSDCHKYWRAHGINDSDMPTIIIKPLLGATNKPDENNDSMTNAITIQQIGACYPSSNLTINLYIVPNDINNLPNVLNTILNEQLLPSTIVIPWGAPESNFSNDLLSNINNIFEIIANKGINIITCNNSSADFPSSSPNVVACGGVKINTNFQSSVFSKPAYQCNLSGTNRIIPDVSLLSSDMVYLLNKNRYLVSGPVIASATMAGFILVSNINKFINNSIYWFSGFNNLGSIINDKLANYINNYIPVSSINLKENSLTLKLPIQVNKKTPIKVQPYQLIATVLPSNATNNTVTWTSSNTKVATVNSSGLLVLVSKGTTTITASLLENGLHTECIINVI